MQRIIIGNLDLTYAKDYYWKSRLAGMLLLAQCNAYDYWKSRAGIELDKAPTATNKISHIGRPAVQDNVKRADFGRYILSACVT